MTYQELFDWGFLATAVIVGLLIGGFLNVVIHRGPAQWGLVERNGSRRGNLAAPRSYCPNCGATLRAVDVVPIISYVVLFGKCRRCAAPISKRYPIIEALGAVAAVAALLVFGPTVTALFAAIFLWFAIALAAIDWETGYLPDALTLPLILIGLIANAAGFLPPFKDAVIGAAVGYGAFWSIGALYKVMRGKDGLGLGDAKLLAAIGAWLGWTALAPVVFAAAMLGLIGVLADAAFGKTVSRDAPIPFGPALACAGATALIAYGLDFPPGFWPIAMAGDPSIVIYELKPISP